jgi:hypothetical protein
MVIIFVGVGLVKRYSHKPAASVLPQSRRSQ